ncbi:uncharacterized protein LOC115453084 [Manduca sexta]|uniref:uncharacterized protein LOC115453084 n=1 Tax=Manduca sexta TaxID=7130 RepID=UPI00188E2588|nr:uncharacterized protein LOC115453084 [Manduca sexta]
MSVHSFYLKLFVFTAINHLHAYSITNTNHNNDNHEYSIESFDDAPKKRHIKHQRPEVDEEISESEDSDLRKEIRRELIHRIIERRLRDQELEERPERITNRRSNGNRWRSRFHSSNDKPYVESEMGKENRRNGDALNRVWVDRNNINSVDTNFNSKWKPIKMEPDHTNLGRFDINTLLGPENYSIPSHRWKPVSDSAHVDSGKTNIDNLLELQNKGHITYNKWKQMQVNPDNNLGKLDINTLMERDNKGAVTIQRWRPIGIYNHEGKVNRDNLLDLDNEDNTNNKWKLIKAKADGNDEIKVNNLLEPDNYKLYFDEDANGDLTVLTDDDIKNIKQAIELDWRNVNQDELIEIFRSYWYKLIVMVEELKEINDQIQTGYLLWLLQAMKETVINNPEYINIYLKSNINDIQDYNKSESQKVNRPLQIHEMPKNELTIDMPPPKGLIKKICEAVNQNVEDFWKIFYSYFSKQPNDRENLLDLEKLYMILTIFTQFNNARQFGLPVEQYVDEIIKIIGPDIHSLGPFLNTETKPSKQISNTPCMSCDGNKIKDVVNNLIEEEKLSGGKPETVPIVPNDPNNNPKIEQNGHALGHKNVDKPTPEIVKHVQDTINVEANTVKPILDTNKFESKTPKPLPIKAPGHFIEIELPVEKNKGVWQHKDDIHKNYPDTTFLKPVPNINIEDYDIKSLPNINNLPAKPIKPMPSPDKLKQIIEETVPLVYDPKVTKTKPIEDLKPAPDSDDLPTKTENKIPESNKIGLITVETKPNLQNIEGKPIKPLEGVLNKDVIIPVPGSDSLRDNNMKPISDKNKIKDVIVETIPDIDKQKVNTIEPMQEINIKHDTPIKSVPDSDNLYIITARPFPEKDNIEKITVDTIPDINNIEPGKGKPLHDLLNKDVIKPMPDSRDKNIKPIPNIDKIKEIIINTTQDFKEPEIEIIKPMQDVDNLDAIPFKPAPDSNRIKDKPVKQTPDLTSLEGNHVNTAPDWSKLQEKPISPISDIEAHTINPIPDSGNKEIKPLRPIPQINVPEHDIDKQQNKHIHDLVLSNKEVDLPLQSLEKWKNILKPPIYEKKNKAVEPNPNLINIPLTNIIHDNKEKEDLNNIDPYLKAKIINLKKHHPNLSIEDIKNIIQQGKPKPEFNDKDDVHDNLHIISPPDINKHEFEVKHPDMIKNTKQNKKVPQLKPDNEYIAQSDADNWSDLPEIENQILSKDISSDKSNIKENVPGIDKTYDYVVKKRPLHHVVDVHDPKNKQINKIDPENQTSVDLISKDTLELLTHMIIVYLKKLIRDLGLEIFITSINFDLLINSLMKILLIILKALAANGVPIRLIMKVAAEIQDKLRLFQSAELQECLRKVSSAIMDIIAFVVENIVQNI